jgi:hypothetical protein
MKLSIEAKVASVVAAAFLAVTVGVVAQANGAAESGGADNYGVTSNPGVNTYRVQQEYDSSVLDRTRSRTDVVRLSLGKNVDGAHGASDL